MTDVRRASADDADELMRLRGVMLDAAEPGPWTESGADVLRRQLSDPAGRVAAFVIDRPAGGGLAACVVGAIDERLPGPQRPSPDKGYVYNVATDPQYRRRGYSRACMAALLDWYADRGVSQVDLKASPEGEPLYTSLGFTRTADPAMRWVSPARHRAV